MVISSFTQNWYSEVSSNLHGFDCWGANILDRMLNDINSFLNIYISIQVKVLIYSPWVFGSLTFRMQNTMSIDHRSDSIQDTDYIATQV